MLCEGVTAAEAEAIRDTEPGIAETILRALQRTGLPFLTFEQLDKLFVLPDIYEPNASWTIEHLRNKAR